VCIYSAQFLVEKKSLDELGPFIKDPSFTYILFTNDSQVQAKASSLGWTSFIVAEKFKTGTLCSKHVKWNPWEYTDTRLYDILVWVDSFSNVNPVYFEYLKTMTPEFSIRKHRSSTTVFDEIQLCFLNKKINEKYKHYCEDYAQQHKFHPVQYWTEIVIHPTEHEVHKSFCKELSALMLKLVYRDQVCLPFVQESFSYTHVKYMPLNFSIKTGKRDNHEYQYLLPDTDTAQNYTDTPQTHTDTPQSLNNNSAVFENEASSPLCVQKLVSPELHIFSF
jgi:hypothetical protein